MRSELARSSVVLTSILGSLIPFAAAAGETPNIVVILADDMGYGDPACNNPDSLIKTPHIDRLANEGMRFTDAHSPGSWCTPSRYGLLTGRYPFRKSGKWNIRCIEEGRATLATLLRDHGYATAMVGKWHLGFDRDADPMNDEPMRGGPLDCGFDRYFGIPSSLDIPPYYFLRGRHPVAPPSARVEASQTDGWTNIQGAFWREGGIADGFRHEQVLPEIIDDAVEFIDTHNERERAPFLLYVALPAPHTPWLPDERFRDGSEAGMYGDFVQQVDSEVGRILTALDGIGATEDTLVLFTSDNGPVWYGPDVERFGHASVGSLRGMKSDAFEGGHRMPFLVRWPQQIAPGSHSDDLVVFTDMMATVAEVIGVDLPAGAGEDSVSFLPSLLGKPRQPRGATIMKSNATVIRDGRWKLITHLGSGGFTKPRRVEPTKGGPTGQLFDLEADLGETRNLWLEEPEVVSRLLDQLDEIKTGGDRSR